MIGYQFRLVSNVNRLCMQNAWWPRAASIERPSCCPDTALLNIVEGNQLRVLDNGLFIQAN
jgi:hypothetical protein